MKRFSINLGGRVNNFSLPKNKPLLPLFEAIVNAIHAIEDRRDNDINFNNGNIIIEIQRDDQPVLAGMSESLQSITGFTVKDNGVGFNEENMASFMESDSIYKANKGGKGVGRFSWLKAFYKVTIESVYKEQGQFVRRNFEFSTKTSEVDDRLLEWNVANDNFTIVKLQSYLPQYKTNVPKQGETVVAKIIQHCLVYLISPKCPEIKLYDNGESFNLNKIFNDTIKTDDNKIQFDIDGIAFDLLNVKMDESSLNGNKLFLCANNRVVDEKELDKYIVDLDKNIYGKHNFYYVGILTSEYFDKNVDMNRLSFSIPEKGNELLNDVSMEQILQESCELISEYLSEYLEPISNEKQKRIRDYVTHDAPQFRHLLKYMPDEIKRIKPNLTDDKLDDELYQIKRKFDKTVKLENKKLLEQLDKAIFSDKEYKEKFTKQITKISEANRAALADYVTHRKIIIELLENGIRKKNDDNFNKESYIHSLVYPMKATSNDTEYENHNLWLIDEKLAYCSYISSDIPFNNDNKEQRTDILILDNPVAVSEDINDGSEFDTIVIFEFKRPMRDDYSVGDNPITQLYGYIEKILEGKAKDKDGRLIRAGVNTKFYLYAVCDVTSSLKKVIRHNDFCQTPDKMGYYKYNDTYNAYVEILSFDKMIKDTKKRNRILFEKLGL